MANRKHIEERILQIIAYIDQDRMLQPLVGSIKLFLTEELLQLLSFLETGDYKPIYLLLDKKIKEYLSVMEEIKQIKIGAKMKNFKDEESEERKSEKISLENMLAF
ncbi:MAG: hypothetical protein Q9M94_02715 [Candidatus Gracilibacteria bacterium]|nr:hypothetical protein [Candidatus Gracilibacteria bacterium]MDQ7023164.1 hypothetical protein [Candidatus Gracilibacteria bacterium]